MNAANARLIRATVKRMLKVKERIALDRDELRDLLGELNDLEAACDEAVILIDNAVDKLTSWNDGSRRCVIRS